MRGERTPWKRWTMLSALAIGLIILPGAAWAQEESQEEKDEQAEGAEQYQPGAEAEEAAPAAEAAAKKEAGEAKPVEEIIVTGSRIGRSNLEDFAHITVLDSEQIALSGVNTIDQLLDKLPSVTLQGLNAQNNNGGWSVVMVDLRNLGVNRTLVLVNGRRFIKSGTFGGVDLNNIPVSMIDRVEVLLDGASAVYGSDAIGGVINIILKEDYDGFGIDLSGGITDRGDGAELNISGLGGVTGENGSFMANFTYYHRNEIQQKDRDWALFPVVFEDWDGDGPDAEIYRMYGSGTADHGRYIYSSLGGSSGDIVMDDGGRTFHDTISGSCTSTNQKFDKYHACGSGNYDERAATVLGDRYNYALPSWLIGQMERFSINTLGHYDFTENLKVYMEGMFTNRWSRNQMAPQPIGFGTSTYQEGLLIPADSLGIPPALAADIDTADFPYLIGLRRMGGVGARIMDARFNVFRIVTGVAGDITDFLSFDVYVNYGATQFIQTTFNSVNRTKMEETLYNDMCSAKAFLGCVPGNFFGGPDDIPKTLLDYIRYTDNETTGWDQFVVAGSLKGEFFDLPGGPFTAVLGAETRKEAGYNRPDAITVAGDSAGNALDPTEGSYNAQEVFAEISLPILKDVLAADTLTVDLAGRFSHYNSFGNDFTYRAGLTWAPIKDVRLRGIFSTAFRAPDIADLYGGVTVSYEALEDPCAGWDNTSPQVIQQRCQAEGVPQGWTSTGSQQRTNIGGNPDLDAETAWVASGGLVFAPTFLPEYLKRLSVTFDYYNIKVENAISGAPPQWLLDTCYDGSIPDNCAFIGGRNVNHELTYIDATLQNINTLKTDGFDFTASYGFDFNLFGLKKGLLNFDARFHGNYMLKYDETSKTAPDETIKYAGTIGSTTEAGTFAHFRFNLYLALSGQGGPGTWSLGNRIRYIGGATVFGAEYDEANQRWDIPSAKIPGVAYWDLVASYTWQNLTFIFGINNLLDKDPPFYMDGGVNAAVQTYEQMGRYIFSRLAYKF